MSSATERELKETLCWAGRWAFFSGAWVGIEPCALPPIHVIATPGVEIPTRLCDPHFQQVNAAGFVTEPYIDPDEYKRRRRAEGRAE